MYTFLSIKPETERKLHVPCQIFTHAVCSPTIRKEARKKEVGLLSLDSPEAWSNSKLCGIGDRNIKINLSTHKIWTSAHLLNVTLYIKPGNTCTSISYNCSNVPYCLSAMSLTNRAISSHAVGSVFRIDSYLSSISNHKLRRSRTRAHVNFCACAVSDTAAHVWNDVAYTGRSTEYYVGLLY